MGGKFGCSSVTVVFPELKACRHWSQSTMSPRSSTEVFSCWCTTNIHLEHKHIPMCFLHINSLGYWPKLFRINISMISEAVLWSLQIPWCWLFTHSVFCCLCKPWMWKAWSPSKQRIQTGEVPGEWKGFIFFARTFESFGLLKCLRCIHCWLHLFSRLTATTLQWKTLQKLWKNSRPRLASRRLWNISVTSLHYMGSSQTQGPSCMMDTHLQLKWTWSQQPTWTSWLSFGEWLWQDTHSSPWAGYKRMLLYLWQQLHSQFTSFSVYFQCLAVLEIDWNIYSWLVFVAKQTPVSSSSAISKVL